MNKTCFHLLMVMIMILFFNGCSITDIGNLFNKPTPVINSTDLRIATPLPPPPETIITFNVVVPSNTPAEDIIYLSVLDEVTGLALNAKIYPMQFSQETNDNPSQRTYVLSLPFAIGSVIRYRYERQAGSIRVAEHLSDGSPVRYRLHYVQAPAEVTDIVSRWTDTTFISPSGRIIGQVTDMANDKPIPSLLVTAGGAQTFTASDGTFLIDGLPPGTHNLVIYALDGAYHTYQQGALVAPDSATPANIKTTLANSVKVIFVVKVPENTPPIVPLRLAGSLYQMGNTFGNLKGGISTIAANMPVLNPLPDGRYTITLSLPVGADIRYKYTLGDGFWNAEHTPNGDFQLRQVVVPEHNVLIEDEVATWFAGPATQITFDLTVSDKTPAEDFVSIQFNPIFGWTEPIPMWKLGQYHWGYILFSPLNLPGNLSYRYCRNSQCGTADDIKTPGLYGAGRLLTDSSQSQILKDQVEGWQFLQSGTDGTDITSLIPTTFTSHGEGFWTGVEFVAAYHPSWKELLPTSISRVKEIGANWLIFAPTWTYGNNPPGNLIPILSPIAGKDALWFDTLSAVEKAHAQGISIALKPTPNFLVTWEEWWQSSPRDTRWWVIWFEQVREFFLNHAELANRSGAEALILGGDWVIPALPGGLLPNGEPSSVPDDAGDRWRALLDEIRTIYNGKVIWSITRRGVNNLPPFLDTVDQIYLEVDIRAAEIPDLESALSEWLDYKIQPIVVNLNLPFILALEYPSDPDLATQLNAYHITLQAINQRPWVKGFVSAGFYPPVVIIDNSSSINGKPAAKLVSSWFIGWQSSISP